MQEPSRSKRFQIHLSTAVVMMFVAGALVWANVRQLRVSHDFSNVELAVDNEANIPRCGFPLTACAQYFYRDASSSAGPSKFVLTSEVYYTSVALDAVFALLVLFIIYKACEWMIGRGNARKASF